VREPCPGDQIGANGDLLKRETENIVRAYRWVSMKLREIDRNVKIRLITASVASRRNSLNRAPHYLLATPALDNDVISMILEIQKQRGL